MIQADTLSMDQVIFNGDTELARNARALVKIYDEAAVQVSDSDPAKAAQYRKRARQARRKARQHEHLQYITQHKIDKLGQEYPGLITYLAAIQTEAGAQVRIMLTSYFRSPGDPVSGMTHTSYDRSPVYGLRLFAPRIQYKNFILLERQDNVIHISTAVDSQLNTLRHELGHAAYAIKQSHTYYQYLIGLGKRHKCYDGHRHDDQSGYLAHEFERGHSFK